MTDIERCPICGWPLVTDPKDGCVLGNCSYRPEQRSPEWYRIKARKTQLDLEILCKLDAS